MLLAAGVTYLLAFISTEKTDQIAAIKSAFDTASSRWQLAEREWLQKAGSSLFEQRKSVLVELRNDWNQVPNVRLRMLSELERDRERAQRLRYLDQFEIENAKIEGIGKGRKLTLASYGIETAADVTQAALTQVPGFGPKTQARMLTWRSTVEQRFAFDPTRHVDQRDIARVEQEILNKKTQIESRINGAMAELRQAHSQIMAARQHMLPQIETAYRQFLQASADKKVITR